MFVSRFPDAQYYKPSVRPTTTIYSQSQTAPLTPLQALDAQQAAELAYFKRQQAIARAREIERERRMLYPQNLAIAAGANHQTVSVSQPGGPHKTSEISTRPAQRLAQEPTATPATGKVAAPQTPVAQNTGLRTNVTTTPSQNNTRSNLTSNTSSNLDGKTSTNSDGKTKTAANISTTPIPANAISSPQPSSSNATRGSMEQAGSSSLADHELQKQTTHSKSGTYLAVGFVIAISFIGALCLMLWHRRRRRRQPGTQRPVDKFNITGPFQKQGYEEDRREMLRSAELKHVGFGGLDVQKETTAGHQDQNYFSHTPIDTRQAKAVSPALTSATRVLSSDEEYNQQLKSSPALLAAPEADSSVTLPIDSKGGIVEGKIYVVQRTFQAALADELIIFAGDRIRVNLCYDDGWCLGENLDSKQHGPGLLSKGVFPRDCLSWQRAEHTEMSTTLPPLDLGMDPAAADFGPGFLASSPPLAGSSYHSDVITCFPVPPPMPRTRETQRMSSLIAGREAQLFLELGEALGQN